MEIIIRQQLAEMLEPLLTEIRKCGIGPAETAPWTWKFTSLGDENEASLVMAWTISPPTLHPALHILIEEFGADCGGPLRFELEHECLGCAESQEIIHVHRLVCWVAPDADGNEVALLIGHLVWKIRAARPEVVPLDPKRGEMETEFLREGGYDLVDPT